jgi:ABC-type lipoprotein export system ATPase subunit
MTAADVGPTTTTVLELAGVAKSYPAPSGPRQVLTGVDLRVGPGETVVLTGRSGSGKITLPLRLGHVQDAADPTSLMERLGIDHLADRFPSEVSLGEQQRAALARAAVVRPALLLADEPIAHQNRTWAEGMMLLLGELASHGTTCLLATHNEVAFDAADRVLELREGALRPVRLHSEWDQAGARRAP